MPLCPPWTVRGMLAKLDSYDSVQQAVVILLYIQVVCGLVGSLSALYSGILVANLMLASVALVGIESGSQQLGRAYVGFLYCMLVLDVVWLMAFSSEIRNVEQIAGIKLGKCSLWSIQLGWWLELLGFLVRCVSAVLWWKIWTIGSQNEEASYSPVGFDQRLMTSSEDSSRNISGEVLGGSIYNPALYASVFRHNFQPYYHPPVSTVCENQVGEDDIDILEGKQRASDAEEVDEGNAAASKAW